MKGKIVRVISDSGFCFVCAYACLGAPSDSWLWHSHCLPPVSEMNMCHPSTCLCARACASRRRKCHLFKCKCCFRCFWPGTYDQAAFATGMRFSQSAIRVSTPDFLYKGRRRKQVVWNQHIQTAKLTAVMFKDYGSGRIKEQDEVSGRYEGEIRVEGLDEELLWIEDAEVSVLLRVCVRKCDVCLFFEM